MSTTWAYLRVSTSRQELDNQRLEILNFANQAGIRVDEFVEVEISSRKTTEERRIDELLARLAPGDTVVVSELSRLGRSLGEMVQIVEQLKEKEVALIAIKQGINTRSDSDMASKCIIYLSGMFAELERDFLSQRTKNGLERAKAQGKVLGRKKGSLGKSKMDEHVDEIKRLMTLKVPKASVAKILGVSRQALYKFIESRNIDVAS
ncbi:recombinase family protein [Desulfovibrio sp. TomC]|uniref:recombinase family protein n=1 Tax=Desulfovibrio sp. TomC TaxID=1562888 RepID=UPI0005B8D7F3|nr:recombinase family protein [Desulfovibrio sp. TomC]